MRDLFPCGISKAIVGRFHIATKSQKNIFNVFLISAFFINSYEMKLVRKSEESLISKELFHTF